MLVIAPGLFASTNANVLLLHAGTNDWLVGSKNPDQAAANLLGIANLFISAKGALAQVFVMKTILAGTDPSNSGLNGFVTTLRPKIDAAFAGKAQCTVVNPPLIPDADYFEGALGVHPIDPGYALMVDDGSGNGWGPALTAAGF